MDTSKEYINQCEKAEEIQKLWEHRTGDVCSPKFSNSIVWIVGFNTGFSELKEKNIIWLPRQDQLQAMTKDIHPKFEVLDWLFTIEKWGHEHFEKIFNSPHPQSMEQLWLAYVMFERYSKQWNGKDWITNG